MSAKFWENKRVLVTGSGGFIGGNLVTYLSKQKAKVVGVARHPGQWISEFKVDAANRPALRKIFRKFVPEICFHLASEALVEQGQTNPYATLKNNFLSTLNVLELCRSTGVGRIIIASTVHVYGDSRLPYTETAPARPSRPYETSKTCADLLAQSYADSFNLPVLIPRFVNIYGPGDLHFSRIIPKTIKSILLKKAPTMWGGSALREYLYIDDALKAYDLLARMAASQLDKNRIFNFGSGQAISARELIRTIIKLSGKKMKIKKIPQERENEISVQRTNWSKARKVLGWKPKVQLREGLKLTLDWYQNYFRIV